jgi:hypothetical protein
MPKPKPEWKEFVGLAIQEGGPQRRVRYPDEELKRRVYIDNE